MTSIFVLSAAEQDLVSDQTPHDNAQDILWSGALYKTIDEAKALATRETQDILGDEEHMNSPKWSDFVHATDVEPETNKLTYRGHTQWECEETGTTWLIREYAL